MPVYMYLPWLWQLFYAACKCFNLHLNLPPPRCHFIGLCFLGFFYSSYEYLVIYAVSSLLMYRSIRKHNNKRWSRQLYKCQNKTNTYICYDFVWHIWLSAICIWSSFHESTLRYHKRWERTHKILWLCIHSTSHSKVNLWNWGTHLISQININANFNKNINSCLGKWMPPKRITLLATWADTVTMATKEHMDSGYKEHFSRPKLPFIRWTKNPRFFKTIVCFNLSAPWISTITTYSVSPTSYLKTSAVWARTFSTK